MSFKTEKAQPSTVMPGAQESTHASENDVQALLALLDATIQDLLETGIEKPEDRQLLSDCIQQETQLMHARFQEIVGRLKPNIPISEEVAGALWRITQTHLLQRESIETHINALCDGEPFFVNHEGRIKPAQFFSIPPGKTSKGKTHYGYCGFRPKDGGLENGIALSTKNAEKLFMNPRVIFPLMLLGRMLLAQDKNLKSSDNHYEFRFGVLHPKGATCAARVCADPLDTLFTIQRFQARFTPSYDEDSPTSLAAVQPGIFRIAPKIWKESLIPMGKKPLVKDLEKSSETDLVLSAEVMEILQNLLLIPNTYFYFERGFPTSFLRLKFLGKKNPEERELLSSDLNKIVDALLGKLQQASDQKETISAAFFGNLIAKLQESLPKNDWETKVKSTVTYTPETRFNTEVYTFGQNTLLSISFRDSNAVTKR